jgi:hypothetical protein
MSRIVVDIASNQILQVEKTPDVNDPKLSNGRWYLPIPEGASVDVDQNSLVIPQDGVTDIAALSAQALLARYPMYSNIAYNFLLEPSDISELDLSAAPAVSPISGFPVLTRAQTGRLGGASGLLPNLTAINGVNTQVSPIRPGMLVTDTIDITIPTGGAGADEFLVWWYLWDFGRVEDQLKDFGGTINAPGTREIIERNQEPGGFFVYLSNDDGVTWYPVPRLTPTDLFVFNTDVRLLFVNISSGRRYLAAYGIMF